ncbi:hypothetical protein D5F01_LYC25150 [Larimichthys crocea]|uniref:Uncharacterized protein n=1 Tax=Larimichthys crocea TaxID=215358 RepID=A0A6G0HCW3_LARCR|nr:hypothetical protein D5F01_LYC25150 [Larimichthys crocea]
MASSFKIPKKKQETTSDPAHLHLQSPLSRLQSPAPRPKGYGDQSNRGRADRMHAGNALGSSTGRQSTPCKPLFRNVVKSLLGLNRPTRGASTANHRGQEARASRPARVSSSRCQTVAGFSGKCEVRACWEFEFFDTGRKTRREAKVEWQGRC